MTVPLCPRSLRPRAVDLTDLPENRHAIWALRGDSNPGPSYTGYAGPTCPGAIGTIPGRLPKAPTRYGFVDCAVNLHGTLARATCYVVIRVIPCPLHAPGPPGFGQEARV